MCPHFRSQSLDFQECTNLHVCAVAHNCHCNSKLLTAQTKIFTAITNNSQHKPKYSQRKSRNSQRKQMTHSTNQNVHSERKPGSLDPWISRTLICKTKRSSPFKITKPECKCVIKILSSRENRQDFSMATLETFTKYLGVIPVEILIRVSNFIESE